MFSNYSNKGMYRSCRPFVNRVNKSLMNMMNKSFHGYCHICYGFGHKDNHYRSRTTSVNSEQRNIKCYNCNKFGLFANRCRNVIAPTKSDESKMKTVMVHVDRRKRMCLLYLSLVQVHDSLKINLVALAYGET